MMALLQRVSQARVRVAGEVIGAIDHGLLALVCAVHGDTVREADALLARLLALRIFADAAGKMNRSVQAVGGGLLLVPQFTLAADTRGGHRPSFSAAARPDVGRPLFDHLLARAREMHAPVAAGAFGADMKVELVNDGPVTLMLDIAPPPDRSQEVA